MRLFCIFEERRYCDIFAKYSKNTSSNVHVKINTVFHEHVELGCVNQNVQVQYVYRRCLCLISDQTTMAQEQKYLDLD